MRPVLILIALCVLSSGCSRVQEAAMPISGKVNLAYPVSPEVRLAKEHLQLLLASDEKKLALVAQQVESRMNLRALKCSSGVAVSRLSSVATVKALALDPRCFSEEDAALLQYFSLRAIGVLASQPPIRPLRPLGPPALLPTGGLFSTYSGSAATEAGVAVLRGTKGEHTAVEIPGGALVSSLPTIPSAFPIGMMLSPNGRILTVTNGLAGVLFISTDTGNKIWEHKRLSTGRGLAARSWRLHVRQQG